MPKIINMDNLENTKKTEEEIPPEVEESMNYCVNHVGKFYDGSSKANSTNVAVGKMIYYAEASNDMALRGIIAQLMHNYRMYSFTYVVQGYIAAKKDHEGLSATLSMDEIQEITTEAASTICVYTDFMRIKLPDMYTTPAPVTGDDPEPDE